MGCELVIRITSSPSPPTASPRELCRTLPQDLQAGAYLPSPVSRTWKANRTSSIDIQAFCNQLRRRSTLGYYFRPRSRRERLWHNRVSYGIGGTHIVPRLYIAVPVTEADHREKRLLRGASERCRKILLIFVASVLSPFAAEGVLCWWGSFRIACFGSECVIRLSDATRSIGFSKGTIGSELT